MNNKPTNKKSQLYPTLAGQLLAPLFTQAQGVIEHRFKIPGRGMQAKFYPSPGALLNSTPTWPVMAHHYFGLATRKDGSSGRKSNLLHLVTFHADIDHGPDRPHQTREDALGAIEGFSLRSSALVDTGNGFHVYWFFLAPLPAAENLARVEAINKGIGKTLLGDPVGDASRVLRIPGTHNVKDPANTKKVVIIWCEPGRRYALEDFGDYVALTPREDKPRMAPRPVSYRDICGTPYGRKALANELARLAQTREGTHFRNIQLNKSAYSLGRLVGGGHLDRDTVEVHLHQVGLNIGLSEREVMATLRSGLEAGMRDPRDI